MASTSGLWQQGSRAAAACRPLSEADKERIWLEKEEADTAVLKAFTAVTENAMHLLGCANESIDRLEKENCKLRLQNQMLLEPLQWMEQHFPRNQKRAQSPPWSNEETQALAVDVSPEAMAADP